MMPGILLMVALQILLLAWNTGLDHVYLERRCNLCTSLRTDKKEKELIRVCILFQGISARFLFLEDVEEGTLSFPKWNQIWIYRHNKAIEPVL